MVADAIISHSVVKGWDISTVVENWTHEQAYLMMKKASEMDKRSSKSGGTVSRTIVHGVESKVRIEGDDQREASLAQSKLMSYIGSGGKR